MAPRMGIARSAATSAALAAALAALTLLVFWPVVTHEFINYDTPSYILLNPHVNGGLTIANAGWALTAVHVANWHPLTWLSHMLDVSLFGLDPAGHHAMNLLFHLVNVVLLYIVMEYMTAERWIAAFVAAAFAIHPAHIESVAWVAERKDLLSTLLMLLTLLAYVRWVRAPSLRGNALVTFLFALGLTAKPMIVTLPFVLLLFDYWPLRRIAPELKSLGARMVPRLVEKIPLFLLAIASSVITFRAQMQGGAMEAGAQLGLFGRLLHVPVAYLHYLEAALRPVELALFYPHTGRPPVAVLALAVGVLLLVSAASVVWIRRRPWFFVGWALFLGTLVPVIGIVQVGAQAWADRYTYVPYIGLFIVFSYGARELIERLRIASTLVVSGAGLLLLTYGAVAHLYLGYWRDSLTLWSHTLVVIDVNYPIVAGVAPPPMDRSRVIFGLGLPYTLLGSELIKEGRYADALSHLDEAIFLNARLAGAWHQRGYALTALGRTAEALESLARAAALDPAYPIFAEDLESLRRHLADGEPAVPAGQGQEPAPL